MEILQNVNYQWEQAPKLFAETNLVYWFPRESQGIQCNEIFIKDETPLRWTILFLRICSCSNIPDYFLCNNQLLNRRSTLKTKKVTYHTRTYHKVQARNTLFTVSTVHIPSKGPNGVTAYNMLLGLRFYFCPGMRCSLTDEKSGPKRKWIRGRKILKNTEKR